MVIVDLLMSDMSGVKLIKLISEMDDKIKIIVVSASSIDRNQMIFKNMNIYKSLFALKNY